MHKPILRNKPRLALVLSVIILLQFCCCILPLGWQVQRNSPIVQQILQSAQARIAPLEMVMSW